MSPIRQSMVLLATLVLTVALASGCDETQSAKAALPAKAAAKSPNAVSADVNNVEANKASPAPNGAAAQLAAPTMLTGTTEPHRRSVVATRVSGIIAEVYVVEGQKIEKGDKIAALETADYRLRVRQAEAGLKLAKVQTSGVQREWSRSQKLVADKAAPSIQFDTLDSQLEGAKGNVALAEVGVAMARKALKDTLIVAPFSGVVTQKMVSEGQWAGAMPPTPIAMVEEVSTIDLRLDVPELWMTRVDEGSPAVVTFAATGATREAKVTRVIPSINPRTRSFFAIIELDNADDSLRPGMFAEVTIPATEGGR